MKEKRNTIIKYVAFGLYAVAMVILLFDRHPLNSYGTMSYWEILSFRTNFIPLKTVAQYVRYFIDGSLRTTAIINLGGNVGMFIPLGLFLAAIWKKLRRFLPHLFTTAVIIIAVELIQLFTLTGSADIDDLLLNVVGSAIGFGVYKVYEKIKDHIIKKKSEK